MSITKETKTIILKDGATSDMTVFKNEKFINNNDAIVYVIHPALGTPAGYYHFLAEEISKTKDCHVVVFEIRGNGTSSEIASASNDWGYYTIIENDFEVHIPIVLEMFTNNPIILIGHSFGAQLQSLYLSKLVLENRMDIVKRVKGIISITSASVYWKNYGIMLLLLSYFMSFVLLILGWFPGKLFGFGGKREAKTVIRDWIVDARTGKWTLANCDKDLDGNLKNIPIPSLFISLDGDPFTNHKMVKRFADKMNPDITTHIKLKPSDLNMNAKGVAIHFRWARSTSIIPYISDWVSKL